MMSTFFENLGWKVIMLNFIHLKNKVLASPPGYKPSWPEAHLAVKLSSPHHSCSSCFSLLLFQIEINYLFIVTVKRNE